MVGPGPWSPPPQPQGLRTGERVQEGCCIVSLRESLTLRPDNQPSSLQARPRFSQTLRRSFQRLQVSFGQPSLFYTPRLFLIGSSINPQGLHLPCIMWNSVPRNIHKICELHQNPFCQTYGSTPRAGGTLQSFEEKTYAFLSGQRQVPQSLKLVVWKNASLHISPACDAIFALCRNQANNNLTTDSSVTKTCGQLEKKPRWWFFWRQRVILEWLQHFKKGKVLTKFVLGLLWRTARQKDVLIFEKVDRKS